MKRRRKYVKVDRRALDVVDFMATDEALSECDWRLRLAVLALLRETGHRPW